MWKSGWDLSKVVTAVIANAQLIDGIDLQVQEPSVCAERRHIAGHRPRELHARWSERVSA